MTIFTSLFIYLSSLPRREKNLRLIILSLATFFLVRVVCGELLTTSVPSGHLRFDCPFLNSYLSYQSFIEGVLLRIDVSLSVIETSPL